jgi:predicted nucleic acid-binding protein
MANAIYWDTSALIKLYAPEPDSSDYLRLLIQQPEDLAISFLHRVELYFALCVKESRGEIVRGSARRLFELFDRHVSAGRYYLIPWGEDVALESRQLLDASLSATPPVMLRSLDGLHLGALRAAKIQSIITADMRMRDAARIAAIGVIEP